MSLRNDVSSGGLVSMPRYFFHMMNKHAVTDPYGTVLLDNAAALAHAMQVARELMFKRAGMLGQRWSTWTMRVDDKDGKTVHTIPFAELPEDFTLH
jgi:hypothetical protein